MPKRLPTPTGVAVPQGCGVRDSKHVSANGAADAHHRLNPLPLHCPVGAGASDAEQIGELSGAVLVAMKQGYQVRFLPVMEFGLLTTETPDLLLLPCCRSCELSRTGHRGFGRIGLAATGLRDTIAR